MKKELIFITFAHSITSFQIIGHRGHHGKFPANTIEGFRSGADYADAIECDVQMTADLQLICNHDPWLYIPGVPSSIEASYDLF